MKQLSGCAGSNVVHDRSQSPAHQRRRQSLARRPATAVSPYAQPVPYPHDQPQRRFSSPRLAHIRTHPARPWMAQAAPWRGRDPVSTPPPDRD